MPLTLEQRVEAVEKRVAGLANGLLKKSRGRKDWRATVGLSKDDPDFEEMIRLGRKYRRGPGSRYDRARS